jgi:MoaA/NifB/PqqE/SkfB family radical SAM enzyme
MHIPTDVFEVHATRQERLFLVLNDACDSKCQLCDYWLIREPNFLSIEFVRDTVIPMVTKYRLQVTCVTGGEPTLHPKLAEIIYMLSRTPAMVTLSTSTSHLDDHFASVAPFIDNYLFSLDGADRDTYRVTRGIDLFDAVLAWPARIRRARRRTDIAYSCVVQRRNVRQLVDIYKLGVQAGVDHVFFRVPELKPQSFGRMDQLSRRSSVAATIDPADHAVLRESIEEILSLDQGRGLLGQTPEILWEKVDSLTRPPSEPSPAKLALRCDVPFQSMVIGPREEVGPCFYLPMKQALERGADPVNAEVLTSTRASIQSDPAFRRTHCTDCYQFDGHKM